MQTNFILIGVLITASAPLLAASDEPTPIQAVQTPPAATVATAALEPVRLAQEQLEELLAPVALYPDPLVALILPASTSPSDVVLASRYLKANPQATSFDEQTWDDAVKLLARYPTIVAWMDENLAWTQQLGDAFAQQPAEVMTTIQRLRARARAAGTLVDTPEQSVTVVGSDIQIIPAQPDVIYVPIYDPEIIYVQRPSYAFRPLISFGIGYAVGHWLAYDCDWHRRTICYVPRPDRVRVWHANHRPTSSVSIVWSSPDRFRDSHWRTWQPVDRQRDLHRRPGFVRGYAADGSSTFTPSVAGYPPRPADSRRESSAGTRSDQSRATVPAASAPPRDSADRSRDRSERSRDPGRPATAEPLLPGASVTEPNAVAGETPSRNRRPPESAPLSTSRSDRAYTPPASSATVPTERTNPPRASASGSRSDRAFTPPATSPAAGAERTSRPLAPAPAARAERSYTPPVSVEPPRTERTYTPPASVAPPRAERTYSPPASSVDRAPRSDSGQRSSQSEARSRQIESIPAPVARSAPARAAEPSRSSRREGEDRTSAPQPD